MPDKRPYPGGNEADDQEAKRAKRDAMIAQAKARALAIAEKNKQSKATLRNGTESPATSTPGATRADTPGTATPASSNMSDIKARMAAAAAAAASARATQQSPPGPVAAARAARLAATNAAHHSPNGRWRDSSESVEPEQEEPKEPVEPRGLRITLHPSLVGADGKLQTGGNRQPGSLDNNDSNQQENLNPYWDEDLSTTRAPRKIVFNPVGKYIRRGEKLREQLALEKVKQQLANAARQAGIDENTERGFLIQQPPEVEWWDQSLLEDNTYDCIDDPSMVKLVGPDSLITEYVQHPVLLKAPQDQRFFQDKPMYLTTKEQKKFRRIRRQEAHKEKQAKIRLGLEPPPEPKVKRGNMMRVLGEQAIADPTAVEQLVERQIQERAAKHERDNLERKLTKEQRHEKLRKQQEIDAQKALYMAVFKVKSLCFGKHRYQIDKNAKEHALTGVVLMNPNMNLIVAEGGAHSLKAYKKLMTRRIRWKENDLPSAESEAKTTDREWLQPADADGNLKDNSSNECVLVFEGEIKERFFRKWNTIVCDSDGVAKDFLGRSNLDSLWTMAASMESSG